MAEFRFLKPQEVIERLRQTIENISNNVGGAAEFELVSDRGRLTTPSLYVLLSNTSASLESNDTSTQQKILHRFDIILHIDDSPDNAPANTRTDRRLAYAENIATNMKMALLRSLVGWQPEGFCHSKGLYFLGDQLVETDRADYYRLYQFEQEYEFDSDEDGLGQIGPYEDLDDFDDLCLDIINKDTEPIVVAKIDETGIHE